jgi:hypothetical protein
MWNWKSLKCWEKWYITSNAIRLDLYPSALLRFRFLGPNRSESVFGPALLPNLCWAVVFGVVVRAIVSQCALGFRSCACTLCCGDRRLPGAIRLLVPVGWHKQTFVRTTGGIRKPFDQRVRIFFWFSLDMGLDSRLTSRFVWPSLRSFDSTRQALADYVFNHFTCGLYRCGIPEIIWRFVYVLCV